MVLYLKKTKWKLKEKREKKIPRAVLEGCQSGQSGDFLKIAKVALFNPCMQFDSFGPTDNNLKCLRIFTIEKII